MADERRELSDEEMEQLDEDNTPLIRDDSDNEENGQPAAITQQNVESPRPLFHPAKTYSASFSEWLLTRSTLGLFIYYQVFHPYPQNIFSYPPTLKQFTLKRGFIATYEFDGYDVTTNDVVYPDHKKEPLTTNFSDGWLLLFSFLGFPSRPSAVKDEQGNITPQLTGWQFIVNLFGGWKSPWSRLTPLQFTSQFIAAFTVKPFVIMPLKLVLIPLKFSVNIIKLVTVFLPLILRFFIAILTAVLITLTTTVLELHKRIHIENAALAILLRGVQYLVVAILSVLAIAVGIAEIAINISSRIGMAITSPAKSVRFHFSHGSTLKITLFGEQVGKIIAYTVGVISALVSIAITAVAWAILLPLAISAVLTFLPVLAPAVLGTLTWFAHLPLIATLLGMANGAFATVGTNAFAAALSSFFAPIITPLSALIGVELSTTVLVAGATLGFCAAPIMAFLSHIADNLSNRWASWSWQQKIGKADSQLFFAKDISQHSLTVAEVAQDNDSPKPSPEALRQVKGSAIVEKASGKSLKAASGARQNAENSSSGNPVSLGRLDTNENDFDLPQSNAVGVKVDL
jgi:hypothetical protein